MVLQEKADISRALGVYFHIPFCIRPCDFCAFYQEAPKRSDLIRYLDGMEREILYQEERLSRPCQELTVFWGGGTPGLLPARDLQRLGSAMLDGLGSKPVEWTVEMSPPVVKADKLRVLKDLGVTRISIGIQSFQEKWLEKLGRGMTVKQIYEAIDCIRDAGFSNLNFDLIFAIPNQTPEDWEAELNEACRLDPTHLSTYCLTFEEDTALWVKLSQGQVKRMNEEEEAGIYRSTWEILSAQGFTQYEVSNFSKPGFTCRHNINTWRMGEWLGVGPSASSQIDGRRSTNVADMERWYQGVNSGNPEFQDEVILTDAVLLADCLIFGLRMNEGVMLSTLKTRFPDLGMSVLEQLIDDLREAGHLEVSGDGDNIRLTDSGRLVADAVGAEILDRVDQSPAS